MGIRLLIDLDKLRKNAACIVEMCTAHGISVTGVTKSCCGRPEVTRAMLTAGVRGIADSRLDNIARMRQGGVKAEFILLRSPSPVEAGAVVELADISPNSEVIVIEALSRAAAVRKKRHGVILMIDSGDLREGVWPDRLPTLVEKVLSLPWIRLVGVGTNHACFGGVLPSLKNLAVLKQAAEEVKALTGEDLELVSGGNSSALRLIKRGIWLPGINHLRVGESIMLGKDITDGTPLPGCFQDVFRLEAEVIECQVKPSRPIGEIGPDAFGHVPDFPDHGWRRRAVLAVGKQDLGAGHLTGPEKVEILGATSDHLVVDVEERPEIKVGDTLQFIPDYGALVGLMTSPYVQKEWIGER